MQLRLRTLACSTAVAAALACGSALAQAQSPQAAPLQSPEGLDGIFEEATELNQFAQASQERIDEVASETSRLLRDYNAVLREIESLKAYNAQQQRVVDDQEAQISELQESIDRVVSIRREITPLMLNMIDSLDDFVELDVPFLLEERRERVDNLRSFMDASDISPSEKFRLVLEAYQIENEYGRTIESYRGSLEIDGAERQVDFLRIGRVVLAYQTTDGESQGFWNKSAGSWQALGASYEGPIEEALRIAKKQISPNIVRLPVTGPQSVQE